MKKYAITIIAVGILAFTAVSCNNAEHGGDMDNTDTATMSPETTVPARTPPNDSDTTATPPVDPGVDTSINQSPKI
jgi:hypothetical protein